MLIFLLTVLYAGDEKYNCHHNVVYTVVVKTRASRNNIGDTYIFSAVAEEGHYFIYCREEKITVYHILYLTLNAQN